MRWLKITNLKNLESICHPQSYYNFKCVKKTVFFLLGLLVNLSTSNCHKFCYLWKTAPPKGISQLFIGIYQMKAKLTVISELLVAKILTH